MKMHFYLILVAAIMAVSLSACTLNESRYETVPDTAGEGSDAVEGDAAVEGDLAPDTMKLHVSGANLVDANTNPVQLKGVSTHGINWYPQYINYDAFKTLRDSFGVNCVRIAMYTGEEGGYLNGGDKEELKRLMKKGVEYATDLDMYAIIDWHILEDNNPNSNKNEAIDFFDEMSKTFADNDNVFYEICNEPNGSTSWSDIKSYAKDVIAAIRKNDAEGLIIVGTPSWSQDVDVVSKEPITEYNNILYTLHFYANSHGSDLRKKLKAAIENGLPVFCTEFGISSADGNGSLNPEEGDKWIASLDDAKISYCIWNLSNKAESSALLKSECEKTSDWTLDDLSDEAKWYLGVLGSELVLDSENKESSTEDGSKQTDSVDNENDKTDNIDQDKKDIDKDKTDSDKKNSDNEDGIEKDISMDAKVVNSWNDGKQNFSQINVVISNKGKKVKNWTATIDMENVCEIDQSWNGKYSVSGKTVTIKPVDYNKEIDKDAEHEIGFIVKSKDKIKINSTFFTKLEKN